MKNEVRSYFPAFFDVDESDRKIVQFETLKELLEIPFIKDWSDQPEFCGFTQSHRNEDQTLLMAQFNEGYEWWVIGILKHQVEELSKWSSKYKEEQNQTPPDGNDW